MEHFLKFPQSILTANLVHMAFFNQLDVIKTSSKPHCSLSPGRIFQWPQFPKLRIFEVPKIFSDIFLPFVSLGSARGLATDRGSRGQTPLHLAAGEGHDSVAERLLEAKAAVDAQNNRGRGLGGGYWGGKPHDALGFRCEVHEAVDGSSFWWILFSQFFGKRVKTFAPMFGVVPSLWVGVSLNQGF